MHTYIAQNGKLFDNRIKNTRSFAFLSAIVAYLLVDMIKRNRNFFIVYCIGSAVAALTVILNSLVNVLTSVIEIVYNGQTDKAAFVAMYVYALTISIFGIFCGLKIANNSPKGFKYLKLYLIPQIPLISIPGFIYYFKLGLDFTIYCILNNEVTEILGTRINFAIGSFFSLNFDASSTKDAVLVGVNIIPILLLASFIKIKRNPIKIFKSKLKGHLKD